MTHNRGVLAGSSTLTGAPFTFSCKVIFADYPRRAPAISAQSFVTAFVVKRDRQECLAKYPRINALVFVAFQSSNRK
jgi:hypothetical protein